jgi:8-oxo-dGTP pyrophosphatase MutT (NUDIX family)
VIDDETLEECLQRELSEELGIQALVGDEIYHSSFDYGDYVVDLHFFRVKIISGEVEHSKGREFRWVELMELPTLDFIPGSTEFIDWARLNL